MKPNPWAQHYQSAWSERAGDPRLPKWLRVASLAYGQHAANGHAQFKPGQVALVLGAVDSETGEVRPLDRGSVQRAIRHAVDFGWLSPTSGARCLVVPAHSIQGGMGSKTTPCPVHEKPRRRHSVPTSEPYVGTECLPSRHSVPTDNALTSTNDSALFDLFLPSPTHAGPGTTNSHRAAS